MIGILLFYFPPQEGSKWDLNEIISGWYKDINLRHSFALSAHPFRVRPCGVDREEIPHRIVCRRVLVTSAGLIRLFT